MATHAPVCSHYHYFCAEGRVVVALDGLLSEVGL